MPQIRYYTVNVQLQAEVSGISDGGGDLTHEEAVRQVLSPLRAIHGLGIVSASATETNGGGRPVGRQNRMLGYASTGAPAGGGD
jgi:hypothetical protein